MEKLSRRKGRCQNKSGKRPGAVLLENVPGFLSEDIIRALFSEYEVQVKSVKFWVLSNREAKRPLTRFAEVEVFSGNAAEEIAVYLDGKRKFGVKLRVRQKYYEDIPKELCLIC